MMSDQIGIGTRVTNLQLQCLNVDIITRHPLWMSVILYMQKVCLSTVVIGQYYPRLV